MIFCLQELTGDAVHLFKTKTEALNKFINVSHTFTNRKNGSIVIVCEEAVWLLTEKSL